MSSHRDLSHHNSYIIDVSYKIVLNEDVSQGCPWRAPNTPTISVRAVFLINVSILWPLYKCILLVCGQPRIALLLPPHNASFHPASLSTLDSSRGKIHALTKNMSTHLIIIRNCVSSQKYTFSTYLCRRSTICCKLTKKALNDQDFGPIISVA